MFTAILLFSLVGAEPTSIEEMPASFPASAPAIDVIVSLNEDFVALEMKLAMLKEKHKGRKKLSKILSKITAAIRSLEEAATQLDSARNETD